MRNDRMRLALKAAFCTLLAGLSFVVDTQLGAQSSHTSGPFQGVKANTGTVTHTKANGKSVLTLSDDFVPPDMPDPHWQIVDSKGKVYLVCSRYREGSDLVRVRRGKSRRSIVRIPGEVVVCKSRGRPERPPIKTRSEWRTR